MNPSELPSPPGPTYRGFYRRSVGSLPDFLGDKLAFFTKVWKDHGDIATLRLGKYEMILLSHPDQVRRPLLENASNYDKQTPGYQQVAFVLGNAVFTNDGEDWKTSRKVFRPAFTQDQIRGFTQLMLTTAERLTDRWDQPVQIVEISTEMTRITFEIMGEALLGSDIQDHVDAIGSSFPPMLEALNARATQRLPLPGWFPTRTNRTLNRALGDLHRVVDEVVRQRQQLAANTNDFRDMVSYLLEFRTEDGQPLSVERVRNEILTIMLAGHETTGVGLVWSLYFLSQHPEAMEKLYAEVDALEGPLRLEDLDRLPYAKGVFYEALRLHPPAWAFSRRALEEDQIGPYRIKKNAVMIIAPYFVHRNPKVWEDPEEFRPERFLPNAEKKDRFAFLAFGAGPRACIGAQFATNEAVIVLAAFVRKFRWKFVSPTPIKPTTSFSFRPEGTPMIELTRR